MKVEDIKQHIKGLLNYDIPGKYLDIRKDDVFLTEYPKSGITWLSFLIANIIYDEGIDFTNIKQKVPPLYTYTKKEFAKLSNPRFIKSHEPYNSNYPTVIYLIRDPRDVVISYYYWHKKYKYNFNADIYTFINDFIKGKVGPYGSYLEHVKSWQINSKKQNILFIKYEDLKSNTFNEVSKITHFLNIETTKNKILKAIDSSSFEKMKELEKKSKEHDFFNKSNKDINFVRKGTGNEWRTIFKEEQKTRFKKHLGKLLIELNYEESLNW